jgi:hypothetical protein
MGTVPHIGRLTLPEDTAIQSMIIRARRTSRYFSPFWRMIGL